MRRSTTFVLAGLLLATAACSGDGGDTGGGTDAVAPDAGSAPAATDASTAATDPASAEPDRTVTADVSVAAAPHSVITAALELSASAPVRVEVTATSGDHVVEVPRTAALAADHLVPVAGMRADRDYDLAIELFDESGALAASESARFTTGPLPAWFADFEVVADADRSSPGVTLVEANQGEPPEASPAAQYLVALDAEGEVVWYYQNTGVVGGVEQTPAGTFLSHYWPFGVREFDLLGNVVGNWQFQTADAADPDDLDVDEQSAVVDEDLLQRPLTSFDGNPGDPPPLPVQASHVNLTSFHHEAWPMPNGNILTMATTTHDLTPEQRAVFCPGDPEEFGVVSDVMVEFEPSGRVVRTWDLWDALDIDEVPGDALCEDEGFFASDGVRDWTHGNAAVYDEARDAVIVSSRHTNQVVAFRHLDAEGPQTDVLWVFGETGTIPLTGDIPRYQHAVEVQEDGSILLYDNGNNRAGTSPGDPDNPTYSRAVLYDVDDSSADPAEWTVTQVWEHRDVDIDGSVVYARFLGDADRVDNGNVLITHGGIDPEDGFQHAVIVEVEPAADGDGGEVVWRLDLGTEDDPYTVYRAERIASLYAGPAWLPRGG